jgi:hypothetical protein
MNHPRPPPLLCALSSLFLWGPKQSISAVDEGAFGRLKELKAGRYGERNLGFSSIWISDVLQISM